MALQEKLNDLSEQTEELITSSGKTQKRQSVRPHLGAKNPSSHHHSRPQSPIPDGSGPKITETDGAATGHPAADANALHGSLTHASRRRRRASPDPSGPQLSLPCCGAQQCHTKTDDAENTHRRHRIKNPCPVLFPTSKPHPSRHKVINRPTSSMCTWNHEEHETASKQNERRDRNTQLTSKTNSNAGQTTHTSRERLGPRVDDVTA